MGLIDNMMERLMQARRPQQEQDMMDEMTQEMKKATNASESGKMKEDMPHMMPAMTKGCMESMASGTRMGIMKGMMPE